jgi:hypothetical protein
MVSRSSSFSVFPVRILTRGITLSGINDALIGTLTDGLPEQYLQGLKELYINFHRTPPTLPNLFHPMTTILTLSLHSSRASSILDKDSLHLHVALRTSRRST